jgi:hypothetical protein
MGLHITLFAVEALNASSLSTEYGVDSSLTASWIDAAEQADCELIFLVGGTEEVFTQCSQNLFVKRAARNGITPHDYVDWTPDQPINQLLDAQFELLQVTVSSSGLPGASPRNGDAGSVGYVVDKDGIDVVLIPYHPGNFIHGHAAKLWSNPYGAIVVHDDHRYRRTVVMRGPARTLSPSAARESYSQIVDQEIQRTRDAPGNRQPAYWFEHTISTIEVETERLPLMTLDDTRPTCSISAAGQGRHGKKPAYFDSGSLPTYDQELQHHREAVGRPRDPSGEQHRLWLEESAGQLAVRNAHLHSIRSE